ncbi:MAG: endonuclease [Acidimicrobiia bacterium]|jgi:endonuclease/exonuclease/phosphatase family metal-dependent hydrolase
MLRLLLPLLLLVPAAQQAQPPAPAELDVMSFNIRYGTANDGANRWELRRQLLFDTIRTADPDVLGVQEALGGQIGEILDALPQYAALGVGRDDGKTRGEYAAILYRRDAYAVSDTGTFWFSDTPDVIASKSWGNIITRICTWARLVDRQGRAFWVFNVHLDHQSQPSRERSTALLLDRIRTRRLPDEPVIVTGDFNAGEQNAAITQLLRPQGQGPAPLIDTFRAMQPDAKDVGTFTGFTIGQTTGDKIDYVLVTPGVEVVRAGIDRTTREGRYPSDHFPVTARVRLPAK